MPARPRILRLTLEAAPFNVTRTGEKVIEVREFSDWIWGRLHNSATGEPRDYDFIQYYNANCFTLHEAVCVVRYRGWFWLNEPIHLGPYSTGFQVSFDGPVFVICHGAVVP